MGQVNKKLKGHTALKVPSKDIAYCNSLGYTKEEIEDWYREFIKSARKDHGVTFLAEEDFIKVYSGLFPGDSSDYCRHIFRTFDLNRNGKVSFKEFMTGLRVNGSDDLDTKLKWAFDVYDVNTSGSISKPEMVDVVQSVYKMVHPDPKSIQPEYSSPEMVVDTTFTAMDTNNDDVLNWDEFREGVKKKPFLLDLLQCNPPK